MGAKQKQTLDNQPITTLQLNARWYTFSPPPGTLSHRYLHRPEPLHNSTDFERHAFRENPYFTGARADRLHNPEVRRLYTIGLSRLITGQQ